MVLIVRFHCTVFPQVPSQVSHAAFWQRYFYKVYKWQLEQDRKAELVRRAEVCNEQKDLDWDEGVDLYTSEIDSLIYITNVVSSVNI